MKSSMTVLLLATALATAPLPLNAQQTAPGTSPFLQVQAPDSNPSPASELKAGQRFHCVEAGRITVAGTVMLLHKGASGIMRENGIFLAEGRISVEEAPESSTKMEPGFTIQFFRGELFPNGNESLWVTSGGAVGCYKRSGSASRITMDGFVLPIEAGQMLVVEGNRAVMRSRMRAGKEDESLLDAPVEELESLGWISRDTHGALSSRPGNEQFFLDHDDLGSEKDSAKAAARRYGR